MKKRYINKIRTYAPQTKMELIEFAAKENKILVAINAEKILKLSGAMKTLVNSNIGYPDGVGAVWALKRKGLSKVVKIPGCELWLDIVEKYHREKTFYFIGGTQEVITGAIAQLRNSFPDLHICNFRNGYIKTAEERKALIEDVQEKKPDVVFVAMGSPKQEELMKDLSQVHPCIYQGLGGSLDVYTGKVKRAPEWWLTNNLEWAYRLVKQPTRIRRQLVYLEFFLKLKLNQL